MDYLIIAINSLHETKTIIVRDENEAKKIFEAMRFMCFGTNMQVYLQGPNKELIDKWDMPKGTRCF